MYILLVTPDRDVLEKISHLHESARLNELYQPHRDQPRQYRQAVITGSGEGNQAKGLDGGPRSGSSTEYTESRSLPAIVYVTCGARSVVLESWTADSDAAGGSAPSSSAPVKKKSAIMQYNPVVHS